MPPFAKSGEAALRVSKVTQLRIPLEPETRVEFKLRSRTFVRLAAQIGPVSILRQNCPKKRPKSPSR